MPTYQYVCQSCGENYEVVQKFTDSTLTIHEPGCGGPVRKKFNAVGVVFKGSGFYRNDSRDSGATPEPAAAGKTDPPAATPAKTDSGSSTPAAPATPASAPASAPAPAAKPATPASSPA